MCSLLERLTVITPRCLLFVSAFWGDSGGVVNWLLLFGEFLHGALATGTCPWLKTEHLTEMEGGPQYPEVVSLAEPD